jgi:cysteine-rich repeat protein
LISTTDVVCFFVPAANVVEILQTKLFSSLNGYLSIRVQWLSHGNHTMNIFTKTMGREQDLIQLNVLVQSNEPKILYIVPSIGYTGQLTTFTVGCLHAADKHVRLMVDSKSTYMSVQQTAASDVTEISFEIRNPAYEGLLNVTLELWTDASRTLYVTDVFPLILPPKPIILDVSPSVCSISGKTQLIISLAFFNASLVAPKLQILFGKLVANSCNYSAQISITCPESKNIGLTQLQVSQGSLVAYSFIEYDIVCPNYADFCKTLGKLPKYFEFPTISDLDPCDANNCVAISNYPNISVISSIEESYVGDMVALQVKHLYVNSLNDIIIKNGDYFYSASLFRADQVLCTVQFLPNKPTVQSNNFKIYSLLTGYQIFSEILLNIYNVPSGALLPKQIAPKGLLIYEQTNFVTVEYANSPFITQSQSFTIGMTKNKVGCLENPKLLYSSKNGSTAISFEFSPFKCLNATETSIEIVTSIVKLNCTMFLNIHTPAALNIRYIDPEVSVRSENPIVLTIMYDGCICVFPWCKESQNVTLFGKSKHFEFLPHTFGPIFASAVIWKENAFVASFYIPATVEADTYIFTTARGSCSASATYDIQKKIIHPSISRILPRYISILGGDLVQIYVDNAVGEETFVLFLKSVQVAVTIIMSDIAKGQFILQFKSPISQTLGAADIRLTLIESGSITISSTSQLFYDAPPLKAEPDTLLSGTQNDVAVTLLHPIVSSTPQLKLVCSHMVGSLLQAELLDVGLENFYYIRAKFLVPALNSSQQSCMLTSSPSLVWPIYFEVLAKPYLVSLSEFYYNSSSADFNLVKITVKNFKIYESIHELQVASADNISLAFSCLILPDNKLGLDVYVPSEPYITLRNSLIPHFSLIIRLPNNNQLAVTVKVLTQKYVPDLNQNLANLELKILAQNCEAKFTSDIEILSTNSQILVESLKFGQGNDKVISFSALGLLPGEHWIQLHCSSKRSARFKVYIDHPGRIITCPGNRGCSVSNFESELMLEMTGFPRMSLGFLPKIFLPQRIVTISAFTEKSLTLKFTESVALATYGSGTFIQHLNIYFEMLNINQTVPLQVSYSPEIIESEIDESGIGFKIRFNQPVRGESQNCHSYFDSRTILNFGLEHLCILQYDFLQVVFGAGANFTTGFTLFDGSSIQSVANALRFQTRKRNVMISNPYQPSPISVSISGPSNVGRCDSIVLHAMFSSPRPESLQFSWSSPNSDILSSYLDQIKGSSAIIFPYMFTREDTFYKIAVRVKNYLGASGQSADHELFFESTPAPQIRLIEPSYARVFHVWEEISVTVALTKSSCVVNDMGALKFTWKVDSNFNNLPLNARIEACTGPMLVIPSFLLLPGTSSVLQLKVLTPNLKSSTTAIFINTTVGQLVILMSNFQSKVRARDAVLLDASTSYDPDDPPNFKSSLQFHWTCKQGVFACTNAKNDIVDSNFGAVVSFPQNFFAANASYTFTLTIRNGRKFATKSVDMIVENEKYQRENFYSVGTFLNLGYVTVNAGAKIQFVLETLEPINSADLALSPAVTGGTATLFKQNSHRTANLHIWNIDASLLQAYAYYNFRCTFRYEKYEKESTISLIVNAGPTGGNCRSFSDGTFDVQSARAFDEIELYCSAFYDQDLPITYTHSYRTNNIYFEYYRGYNSATKMSVLPGVYFFWKVELFDNFGAAGTPVTGQITVLPSSTNIQSQILAAVHSKNIGVTLAFVSTMASIVDDASSTVDFVNNTIKESTTRSESYATKPEICSNCKCVDCDLFRTAIDLVGTMSADFSKDQVLKSLMVFNGALKSANLRDNLNSSNILATVDFISQMLEKLSLSSRMKTINFQDVSIISSTISSISAFVSDRISTLAFKNTAVLQGVVLPTFLRAFSESLKPRLDDVYISNSRMKIAVSKRFHLGEQLIVASTSFNALPRVTLSSSSSKMIDGSEIAVLLSYGLLTKVSPTKGVIYTTIVDFSVHSSSSRLTSFVVIEFSIDESRLQMLRSDRYLSDEILRAKSRVHDWNVKEMRWILQASCIVLEASLNETGVVVARCPFSSESPKAVSYDSDQSVCSDGFVTGSEICDDGNLLEGDGCNSECNIEPGWQCESRPSKCELLSKYPFEEIL